MNKEQLQAAGLTDEQITLVLDGFKGFVPPSRLNEVIEAKKQAEAQLKERDKQLEELKNTLGAQGDLVKQIEGLQADNEAAKQQYELAIAEIKKVSAIETALAQSGARNIKAVKALLDIESIKLDGDKLDGFETQIKALKESEDSSYMFKTEEKHAVPTGMRAASNSAQSSSNKPMSLTDAIAQRLTQS